VPAALFSTPSNGLRDPTICLRSRMSEFEAAAYQQRLQAAGEAA
jgi:hypothetical protein